LDPDVKGMNETTDWLALCIHDSTGLPRADILEAIHRLPLGQGLEGGNPGSLCDAYGREDVYGISHCEGYGGPQRDLTHVLVWLRELDNDGTTARIWQCLRRRWPIFGEMFPGKGGAVNRAEATRPSQLLPGPVPATMIAASPTAETLADGIIEAGRIWLKGKRYRLTPQLRQLLAYLLSHPGAADDDVIREFAWAGESHLHKRLKDLRDKLAAELRGSGWELHIRTDETLVDWNWVAVK
jgi:hypothetical protein